MNKNKLTKLKYAHLKLSQLESCINDETKSFQEKVDEFGIQSDTIGQLLNDLLVEYPNLKNIINDICTNISLMTDLDFSKYKKQLMGNIGQFKQEYYKLNHS